MLEVDAANVVLVDVVGKIVEVDEVVLDVLDVAAIFSSYHSKDLCYE